VLAASFIDHEGRVGDFKLTDSAPRPRCSEATFVRAARGFQIRGGKIEQVEAVFITVPYNMPSPWDP
jgi:hypothetical protein